MSGVQPSHDGDEAPYQHDISKSMEEAISTKSDTTIHDENGVMAVALRDVKSTAHSLAAATGGPARSASPFRFLDLTAELRNAIYNVSIASDKEASVRFTKRHAFLFPQTCRQIRCELHSAYSKAVPVHLHRTSTANGFPKPLPPPSERPLVTGNLLLFPPEGWQSKTFLIYKEFLCLIRDAPHLHIQYTKSGAVEQYINVLLDRTDKSAARIKEGVELVCIASSENENGHTITCYVRFEPWLQKEIMANDKLSGGHKTRE